MASLNDGQPVLRVDGLSVEFVTELGWLRVVDNVSFDVRERETLGLIGESGCGKSVTAQAIMGLITNPPGRIACGSITLDGRDLLCLDEHEMRDVRGRQVAMVFQEPMTSINPAFTIGQQIDEILRRHLGLSRQAARKRSIDLLDRVGIPAPGRRVDDYPHQLSGGMRQRALIAMALSCGPRLLIADEPTTALDVTVQAQVLELLSSLQSDFGMSVLLVTHDLGVVAETCDRVVVMYAGEVIETSNATSLFARPRHPYTAALLECLPGLRPDLPLRPIPGLVPARHELPAGCLFHPRCRHATDQCAAVRPDLTDAGPGRRVRCIRADELELEGVGT